MDHAEAALAALKEVPGGFVWLRHRGRPWSWSATLSSVTFVSRNFSGSDDMLGFEDGLRCPAGQARTSRRKAAFEVALNSGRRSLTTPGFGGDH